jgi:PAS domain S-box-containing protein
MEPKAFRALLQQTLAIPLLVLTLLAMVLVGEIQFLSSSLGWVDHTDQVIAGSRQMIKLIIDMETGVRGYQNTGRQLFLEPYNKAQLSIDSTADAIDQLVSDNPSQQSQLANIRRSFDQWRLLSGQIVETHHGGQESEYAVNIQGQQLMDLVRKENEVFIGTEEGLRAERVKKAHNAFTLLTLSCALLSLGAGVFFAIFFRRQMRLVRADFQKQSEAAETREEERKLKETELRKSNARVELSAEVAGLGEWEINLSDRTGSRSKRHDEIMGYDSPLPVWSYEMFLDRVLPQNRSEVEASFATAQIVGTWDIETEISLTDGEVRWIWVCGRCVPNETGQAIRMFGTLMDITSRKRAEQRILHLASIPELHPNPIVETDLKGTLTYINAAALRQFPTLAELGATHSCLTGLDSTIEFLKRSSGGSFTREIVNNENTYLQTIHYAPELGVIRSYFSDISHLKQVEEQLREKEERFRSMFEHAAVGMEQVAPDGVFVMVNPALCLMLEYSNDELVGKNCKEVIHPDDLKRQDELLMSLYAGEVDSYQMEKRYVCRSGNTIWVSTTSSLVNDASGNLLYRISIVEDISKRKKAEDQIQQGQKMEAIGRLAGGLAHDFNTLLGVILGYSDLALAELPPNSLIRSRVEQIEKSAQTGAVLTKQLLAFSRQQSISPQVIDLRGVVLGMEPMLRRLLSEDIEILVLCSDESCPVNADPSQMQQVLLNLAANAGHAMPRGGTLTIDVRTVDLNGGVRNSVSMISPLKEVLTISDTGKGMAPEVMSHIFEPFFTTKPIGEGTGLGLATVYGIVKQSGGEISVSSEPGEGTTFKVSLPRSLQDIAVTVPVNSSVERLTGNETILLVEDSAPLRELTREVLAGKGYSVIEATDGIDALELSRNYVGTIDLLITDIAMPRMRGTDLAEYLVKERPAIAVLILSGYADDAISHIAHPGRISSLEKPCASSTLLKTVRRVLDEWQATVLQNAS